MYVPKLFLINIRDVQKGLVALVALFSALRLLHLRQEFRTTLLQQLAVRVVVFESDAVLFHDEIVHELR